MTFFETLNFSSVNEDGATEIAALEGARRIVCITGSGTRPLDLLLAQAQDVVALDMNPAQNALLALKIAAIESLPYEDYLAFLGIAPSVSRDEVYGRLRDRLPSGVRRYWDDSRRLVRAGIWSAGKWERLLRWNAIFLALFRKKAIADLMNAATLEEQAHIWKTKMMPGRLGNALQSLGRDLVWRISMREPSAEFVPSAREAGERIARDFESASRRFLFRESDFVTLAFYGKHSPDGALPVHLRRENYEIVRGRLHCLRIVDGGLADLERLDVGPADGFSLSDFGSYCSPEVYAACWKSILRVATPGARFCERIFMNAMEPPHREISVDHKLSEKLDKADKAVIYRIRAGSILPLD